jgi:adenylylsulfate reductase subunit B
MSILIDSELCRGCGKCKEVCPGNLIKLDDNRKAYIKYPKDCWGCTACLKECQFSAIRFYLGADIGGMGSKVYTQKSGDVTKWVIEKYDNTIETVEINSKEANKY